MPLLKLDEITRTADIIPKTTEGRVMICLGCNQNPKPGYINVDIEAYPGVDVVADLDYRWPWEDNTADYIVAEDLVEHLKSPIHTMNEAWRVLKDGGIFNIKVPSTESMAAFQDPTHVSFWNENSFRYYMDESVPGSYRGIYSKALRSPILCRFLPRQIVTTVKNPNQEQWVLAVLTAKKS